MVILVLSSCAPIIRRPEKPLLPTPLQPAPEVRISQTIRVHLFTTKDTSTILCPEGCIIETGWRKQMGDSARITLAPPAGKVVSADSQSIPDQEILRIQPLKKSGLLSVAGKLYRGSLSIHKDSTGAVAVINEIDIEDYLRGVLPPEIGRRQPAEFEAVKAQAVAARTYTLSHLNQFLDKPYDLESDTRDQLYGGVAIEDPFLNQAIDETRGQVATYQGQFINAYYHANCGGNTEYISQVWDKPQENYLVPVNDSDYCRWAKNYQWQEVFSRPQLESSIKKFLEFNYGRDTSRYTRLENIAILNRTTSGRVDSLMILLAKKPRITQTPTGPEANLSVLDTFYVLRDQIRWALRGDSSSSTILRSTKFEMVLSIGATGAIDSVFIRGFGTGHGVGMCQTGAIEMARRGMNYQQILKHYYPAIQVKQFF